MKAQHQQVQHDRRQTLTEFIKEGEVNLKHGEQYQLTDMTLTSDNKLLLCNYLPSGIDKLYGVLTWKSNYCFICTWY
jgi:hypothetical protein